MLVLVHWILSPHPEADCGRVGSRRFHTRWSLQCCRVYSDILQTIIYINIYIFTVHDLLVSAIALADFPDQFPELRGRGPTMKIG